MRRLYAGLVGDRRGPTKSGGLSVNEAGGYAQVKADARRFSALRVAVAADDGGGACGRKEAWRGEGPGRGGGNPAPTASSTLRGKDGPAKDGQGKQLQAAPTSKPLAQSAQTNAGGRLPAAGLAQAGGRPAGRPWGGGRWQGGPGQAACG